LSSLTSKTEGKARRLRPDRAPTLSTRPEWPRRNPIRAPGCPDEMACRTGVLRKHCDNSCTVRDARVTTVTTVRLGCGPPGPDSEECRGGHREFLRSASRPSGAGLRCDEAPRRLGEAPREVGSRSRLHETEREHRLGHADEARHVGAA